MGEAKRRKKLDPNFGKVSNGKLNNPKPRDYYPLWTFTIEDEVFENLTLQEALNYAGFYTKEQGQSKLSQPFFVPDVCNMQINDKVYERAKQNCLKKGYLNVGLRGLISWEGKSISRKKRGKK
jgi:hypothetical protein